LKILLRVEGGLWKIYLRGAGRGTEERERERERDAPWSMVAKQAYLSVGYIMSTKTSETRERLPPSVKHSNQNF